MQLDSRTLLFVAIVVALIPGVIGALVWQTRRTYPGRWALGNLLAALAMLLLCLRGYAPDWISILVANSLAITAGVLFFQGIRKFRGARFFWWPEFSIAVAAIAAIFYFRYVTNDIKARVLVIGLTLGGFGMACGISLLKAMPRNRRIGLEITGLVFILAGLVNLARGIYAFGFAPIKDLFYTSTMNALFFLAISLGIISWSFGFMILAESETQFRQLAKSLQDVREQERARIARELHDELGQVLTAIKMQVGGLAHCALAHEKSLSVQFDSTLGLVDETIRNVRRIATELRPPVLDLGLADAIEWLVHEFHSRTGIDYDLALPAQDVTLDAERSTAVFRICQETLTNVARHSSATKIDVRLEIKSDLVALEVRDNGKGLPETCLNDRATSLGILGMRERARAFGGEANVSAATGGGTMMSARIPT